MKNLLDVMPDKVADGCQLHQLVVLNIVADKADIVQHRPAFVAVDSARIAVAVDMVQLFERLVDAVDMVIEL